MIATLPLHGTWDHVGYRIVNLGKLKVPELTIADCTFSKREATKYIILHLILGMKGGGPQTTTKTAHRIQVKNSIASSLLYEGHELSWVSQMVDKLIDAISVKQAAPVTTMPPGPSRINAIYALMKQANLEIPTIKSALTSQGAMQQKSKKRLPVMPCPSNYRVIPGTLLNEDDSHAHQAKELHAHQRGFCLVTLDEATPWLNSGELISADELALIVIGHVTVDTPLKVAHHTLPCIDQQNRECLLACSIFQLGEKSIRVTQWADQKVAQDHTTMVAVTIWRDEVDSEWSQICSNPFQFVRRTLNHNDAIVAMWGKSFRKNKTACAPRDAASLQIHCSLKDSALKQIMLDSGYNHLWLTPKQQNGRPHEDWKLIWLDPAIQLPETKVIGAKLTAFCGISKGTNRFAVRVMATQFETSWKIIHPGVAPPEQVPADFLYKLDNLPFGTTQKMLQDWATHHKLRIRAIRALGPRGWLIGTPAELPSQQYAFNGTPILIRPVQPRHIQHADPVVAGPKPVNSTLVTTPLQGDPWARWQGTGLSTPPARPASSQTGPTESKLQEHDTRLEEITATLASLKDEQSQHKKHFVDLQAELKTRDTKIIGHLDHQIQNLRTEMDQSFTQALKNQSQKFDSNLQELKQILLASAAKRKTPEGQDEEM
eukprot:Skav221250  [mRNA]  locus=scaffold1045:583762:585732:+ [translate_table: standard]